MFERFTNQSRRVVVLAQEEARGLNHNYIGTGHLLLGLIRQGDNTAIKILGQLGADLTDLGARVTQELRDHPEEGQDVTPAERERRQVRAFLRDEVQGLLDKIEDRLSAIERHLGITRPVSVALRSLDERIAQVRRDKEAGGGVGESDELLRQRARVARLEALLREAGIDPDGPQDPPAATG